MIIEKKVKKLPTKPVEELVSGEIILVKNGILGEDPRLRAFLVCDVVANVRGHGENDDFQIEGFLLEEDKIVRAMLDGKGMETTKESTWFWLPVLTTTPRKFETQPNIEQGSPKVLTGKWSACFPKTTIPIAVAANAKPFPLAGRLASPYELEFLTERWQEYVTVARHGGWKSYQNAEAALHADDKHILRPLTQAFKAP